MKNNVGDILFDNEPDRYPKPIRYCIYFFVGLASPFIFLWMGVKNIGEIRRIGDKNIHL